MIDYVCLLFLFPFFSFYFLFFIFYFLFLEGRKERQSWYLWLDKGKLLSLKYEVYESNEENLRQTQLRAVTTNLNQNNIYSTI